MIFHGVGLNETVLVHHPGVQGNRSTVGDEFAFVVHRPAGQRDLHAHATAIRTITQQHGLSRREANGAARRLNAAVVFNLIGNQKC